MIKNLSKQIHENNVKKGFYENEKNIGEMLCLIHSEVSEALECDRKGVYCKETNFPQKEDLGNEAVLTIDDHWKAYFERNIKDTFEDELADIVIRVFDLAYWKGIDLEKHILAKMRYNAMRSYKHGKKY